MHLDIRIFDEQKADEHDLRAYYIFFMKILSEARPDEPPRPYDKFIKQVKHYSKSMLIKRWVVWHDDDIIAYHIIYKSLEGENQHFPEVDIFVLPEWRRKGIATVLLSKLNEECGKLECSLLEFSTFSNTPSGTEFLKGIGAKKGTVESVNQLLVKDIDWDLMSNWVEISRERAVDYELDIWYNGYPDAELEKFVELFNDFWNSIPMGDLDFEYEELSAEYIHNGMESKVKRGWHNWIMVVKHIPTGNFAGFTYIIDNGFNPDMLNQGNTGVAAEHRNKGLGRLLKASLLKHVLTLRPEVKKIRSENDTSNKAMLNINNEMGYKTLYWESYWQIKTAEVDKYLNSIKGR